MSKNTDTTIDSDMGDILAGMGSDDANNPLANLDLSEKVIPSGTEVVGRITEATSGTTQAGAPKITLQIKVSTEEFGTISLLDTVPIMDTTMWRVKSLFAAANMLSGDGSRIIGQVRDLVGKEVRFKVSVNDYNGRVSNKVDGRFMSAA